MVGCSLIEELAKTEKRETVAQFNIFSRHLLRWIMENDTKALVIRSWVKISTWGRGS
jgi:hypothetical protein